MDLDMVHSLDECRHCGNNKHGSGDCRFERTLRLRLGNSRYFGPGACRRCGMSNHQTPECAIPGTKRVFKCLLCGSAEHYSADHRQQRSATPPQHQRAKIPRTQEGPPKSMVEKMVAAATAAVIDQFELSTPRAQLAQQQHSPPPMHKKPAATKRAPDPDGSPWNIWQDPYEGLNLNQDPYHGLEITPRDPTAGTSGGGYEALRQAQAHIKSLKNRLHAANSRANKLSAEVHELRIRLGEIPRPRTPPPAEDPEYDV